MLLMHCLFDYSKQPPRPLLLGAFDGGGIDVVTLYFPGTGKTLADINQDCAKIRAMFETNEVLLSDFKSYITAFGLDISREYRVYDMCQDQLRTMKMPAELSKATGALRNIIKVLAEVTPEIWQHVIGSAQLAYQFLEERGVSDGVNIFHPLYGLTFSGRSRTSGYNIQGTTPDDVIRPVDSTHDVFVQLDWMAADFRVAGLMSGDQKLNESFKASDPYTFMAVSCGGDATGREICKKELLSSLNALRYDSLASEFYPTLYEWMLVQAEQVKNQGFLESVLGRKFWVGQGRTSRSVFNATIQGSVAHAMQLTLQRLYKCMPNHLVTEIHDSVIFSCESDRTQDIIDSAVKIMLHPFLDILVENPIFPLRVSVGVDWRKWKLYKVYR